MSLFSSIANKSKLNAAIDQTAEARKSEGDQADQLYKKAYLSYEQILGTHAIFADTLYNWGFALFNHAQTKSGNEADKLYQEATEKFLFCMVINPSNLKAAIDWGVTLMEQARARGADPQDVLYDLAIEKLQLAESITPGSTTYNLACIQSLRGEFDAAKESLEAARDFGSLPDKEDILKDPDLATARRKKWFKPFMESLDFKETRAIKKAEEKAEAKAKAIAKIEAKHKDVTEKAEKKKAEKTEAKPESDNEE